MNKNSNIGFVGLGNMGKPIFEWTKIPLAKKVKSQIIIIDQFELYCVSMGNPHGVIFFEDENSLNKVDIESICLLYTSDAADE